MPHPSPTSESILHSLQKEPWILAPELELCVVGSSALRIGCELEGLPLPPRPGDVDLAWRLPRDEGAALLAKHGAQATGSAAAAARGTLHVRLCGEHVELTSFRGGGKSLEERIREDALRREATIGALFFQLANGQLHDPQGGLADWRHALIRACGSPEERLREHPLRAIRYLRRSSELGFDLEPATRQAIRELAVELCPNIEGAALTVEIRKALLSCPSPGTFLLRLFDEGLLTPLLPELASLFQGHSAEEFEKHPGRSPSLPIILALEEAAELGQGLGLEDADRILLLLSVLCHEIGKRNSCKDDRPTLPGQERSGGDDIGSLWQRLPGLADKRVRRLCAALTEHHHQLFRLRNLPATTAACLWEETLQRLRDSHALIAWVSRCDQAGHMRHAEEKQEIANPPPVQAQELPAAREERILHELTELDRLMRNVRGNSARKRFGKDLPALRKHLHGERVRALQESGFTQA
ncbi:MAG: hypothetical protein CSA62_12995 [Planctomycetota bacterium]|nr:MAG: hypothetical protein CSA62_12995 [Planctomycetota bacterium]